ncbi:MAG: glycosyltransferase [Phycisphaerales bacterium]|nr:glycosyltransferase [Phycisphaerales bacterium]
MISYIIPTRDRPERLAQTLGGLARLAPHEAEVIVIDNASDAPPAVPATLTNGLAVRVIRLRDNLGAAARNVGVRESDAAGEWVIMLDDDSCPLDVGFIAGLRAREPRVAAVMADIHLPRKGCREAGGLPEVFIGCGVAIRRGAFLETGGYDAAFGYYAEEYDLAAKLLMAGHRIEFDREWRIDHQKDDRNRDMNLILARLIRNNGWVMRRWAPPCAGRAELRRLRRRYRAIAEKERAIAGFGEGLVELRRTMRAQPRMPMPREIWDRFTGLAHARAALQVAWRAGPFRSAAIVEDGKNVNIVRAVLAELGVREVGDPEAADAVVIGTLSPGPMLDARERWGSSSERVLAPWLGAVATPCDDARAA